jgi:DNA-binding PadR family transcriptional regulator
MALKLADTALFKTPSHAARTLMLLGLLQRGPLHGYELYRIIVAHGAIYSDFKKPTLYHLLGSLKASGAVKMTSEAGARGRRGERMIYSLTKKGQRLFNELLRATLGVYQPVHTGLDVAIVFMARLPPVEARALLTARRKSVLARRDLISSEPPPSTPGKRIVPAQLALDHAHGLLDAELAWIEKTMQLFKQRPT